MTDDLDNKIIRTLGSNGSMSVKSLKAMISDPDLERSLKALVRKRKVTEEFAGSYGLTPTGRKDFDALTPAMAATWPPPAAGGVVWARDVLDDPDDEDEEEDWLELEDEEVDFDDDFPEY